MSARSLAIKGRTQSPRDINSRPAPKTATVAPKVIGGTPCLCQFRIRVQILPLKHVPSRQLPDGLFESLGSTASGTIFGALPRSRRRSAGLKKRRRRGCRRAAKRPSLIFGLSQPVDNALLELKIRGAQQRSPRDRGCLPRQGQRALPTGHAGHYLGLTPKCSSQDPTASGCTMLRAMLPELSRGL